MSFNNAETFGLLPRKGTLSVGSDGDITIVDLEQERTIRADDFHGASNFTPYEGMKVFGWPIMTILRGNVVYAHGKILREGSGEFIPRYPGVSQKSGLRKQVVSRANTRDI
jgi:dihydropyrimidinase